MPTNLATTESQQNWVKGNPNFAFYCASFLIIALQKESCLGSEFFGSLIVLYSIYLSITTFFFKVNVKHTL